MRINEANRAGKEVVKKTRQCKRSLKRRRDEKEKTEIASCGEGTF